MNAKAIHQNIVNKCIIIRAHTHKNTRAHVSKTEIITNKISKITLHKINIL